MKIPTKSIPSKECQRTTEYSPPLRKIPHTQQDRPTARPRGSAFFARDLLARLLIEQWA